MKTPNPASAVPRSARLAGSGTGGEPLPPLSRIKELLAVVSSRVVVLGEVGRGQFLSPAVGVSHSMNPMTSVPVDRLVVLVKEK